MKTFKNPFFPNRPVTNPEYFEGRETQMGDVISAFLQTSFNNPVHFVITGDRGIGKSSLLFQSRKIAQGDETITSKFNIETEREPFNFVTCWVDAVEKQSVENLAQCILRELNSELTNFIKSIKIELDLGGYVQVGKKDGADNSLANLITMFCKDLEKIHKGLEKKGQDGIIIFVDELDKMDAHSGIATFFKLTTERLAREGITNILFACSGITGAIQKLEDEHASIFRTFQDIPLARFSEEETNEILETGFRTAGFTYDAEILKAVFNLSGGFPEPIHVLGSEMLNASDDLHLDIADYQRAVQRVVREVRKNKLGDLLKKAGYGKYQLILEAIAKHDGVNVPLEVISSHLKQDANQFSTNLGTLTDKGILSKVDRGVYAFADPLLKEYIKSFGVIRTDNEGSSGS